VYDNGTEFKLNFEALCDSYGLKRKPTTIKNPQANSILERIHKASGDMLRTSNIDMSDTITPEQVDTFVTNAAWAIRATYHTVLGTAPGTAVFGRDMLFDIPHTVDWNTIGQRRQAQVDKNAERLNRARIDHDYCVGDKVLLFNDGIRRKGEDIWSGPYVITQVFTNGTVRIERGKVNERLNIKRIKPYFEE